MPEQELRIEVLLEEVIKRRTGDLHIQVGLPPMLRIDGIDAAIAGFDALDEAQSRVAGNLRSSTKISSKFFSRTKNLTSRLRLVRWGDSG